MGKGKKGNKEKEPDKDAPPPSSYWWSRYWPVLMVAALPFFLYSGSLNSGFVWDDHNLVEKRAGPPSLADLGRLWISDFWGTDGEDTGSQYYRPLTTSTFFIDRIIHGTSPRGYHLTNIIIYSMACALAFLVFQRLLPSGSIALLMGLAFAAHPAHTENVAWVSGRTDIVCAAMMLGALLAYLRAEETGKPRLMALSVALFLLSLFGKEMSITLVAVIFIHQWLVHGLGRRAVLRALPFLVAAFAFWTIHALAAPHMAEENIYTTPLAYVLNVIRNLALGAWHCLVPGGFHYLVTATREEAATAFQLPRGMRLVMMLVFLAALMAGALAAAWKKERVLALGLASGLLCLVPISGIIPIGVIFAIRLLFIPGFFFLLAAGAILARVSERNFGLGGFKISWPAAFMAPVIIIFAVITFLRVPAWQNDVTLMESVLAKEPDAALAHFIMGNGLVLQGREKEAAFHFKRAIALRPGYAEAQFNLGIIDYKSRRRK